MRFMHEDPDCSPELLSDALGVKVAVGDVGQVTVDVEQTFEKAFGARVRDARDGMQWSQRKLAEELERLGVKLDPSAVTRIERGTREVKLREAAAIATALGVKLEDLAPPPTATPREQFDAWVLSAGEQLAVARRALAAMVSSYAMALHVIDHHPDVLRSFGIDLTDISSKDGHAQGVSSATAQAIAKKLSDELSSSPAALSADAGQAEALKLIAEAAMSNLIGVWENGQADA